MGDPGTITNIVQSGGVVGLLVLFMVGLVKRWWVVGWAYDDCRRERDEWKELALTGTRAAERAVDLAREVAPPKRRAAVRREGEG